MFASSSNKSKTNTKTSSGSSNNGVYRTYPELVVFDLDACLWDQEMFEMPEIPSKKVYGDLGNGKGEGVTGVMSGYHKISLHKGSLLAFQEHYDGKYPGMKMALASSANTPFAEKIGRKALQMLEVIPGVSVWDVLMRDWSGKDVNQIGRQYPLSPNKAETHFPLLKKAIGGSIRYDRMLFFDDCNWGDHCGNVARNCREKDNDAPVATLRTPQGLTVSRWRDGLDVFQKHAKTYKIK